MTDNPALRRLVGNDPKQTGRKAEARFAKRHGARPTPASGAASSKGDARVGRWLVEHKNTVKESLSVKVRWLRKIAYEASMSGAKPALVVSFSDESGRSTADGRWVMIPESEWRRLTDEAGD